MSKLELADGDRQRVYFVKRQENQFRYTLRYPFGRLTFEDEVDAIRLTQRLQLPTVEIACSGVVRAAGNRRGILVTSAIQSSTLAEIIAGKPDWAGLLPVLENCGKRLYRIHEKKIRHGALYPNHIFLDIETGAVQMIDFEGTRLCSSSSKAIKADMPQLLRRLGDLPAEARDVLLKPYYANHRQLLDDLLQTQVTE